MRSNVRQGTRRSFAGVALISGAVAGALLVAAVVGINLWKHPFETKIVDRTPPVTLEQLRDLAEYKAASGNFEVLIDTEEDVKYLPAAIAGERTFFIGVGSVDAVIDFDRLTPDRIQVAQDRTSAVVVLPKARLLPAVVDPEQSHVAARKRGLVNRVAGMFNDSPTSEQPLYLAAQAKMQAAAEETELRERAERNTADMLGSLIRSLGYRDVTVRFEDVPASVAGAAG
jgi:Protein of unknown function (DUF4230)